MSPLALRRHVIRLVPLLPLPAHCAGRTRIAPIRTPLSHSLDERLSRTCILQRSFLRGDTVAPSTATYAEAKASRHSRPFRAGTQEKESEVKKGFKVPRLPMANTDLARLINSDEVQSVVNAPKAPKSGSTLKKNPLRNLGAMLKLNPYAKTLRRREMSQAVRAFADLLDCLPYKVAGFACKGQPYADTLHRCGFRQAVRICVASLAVGTCYLGRAVWDVLFGTCCLRFCCCCEHASRCCAGAG